jgi:DNA/RNA-binding domain of Phe-tRNA-synthetase-like protein
MHIEDIILGMEVEFNNKIMIVTDTTSKGKVVLKDEDGNEHVSYPYRLKTSKNILVDINYNDVIAIRDYLGALTEDDKGYTNDSLYRVYNKLCDAILKEKESTPQ